jgi:hypothetical protein
MTLLRRRAGLPYGNSGRFAFTGDLGVTSRRNPKPWGRGAQKEVTKYRQVALED